MRTLFVIKIIDIILVEKLVRYPSVSVKREHRRNDATNSCFNGQQATRRMLVGVRARAIVTLVILVSNLLGTLLRLDTFD